MDEALEVPGAASNIRPSDGEDWCARAFPLPEAISRSRLSCETGVRERSGIRDRLGHRRAGNLSLPDLCDPVVFLLG